jgi:hypothetical protein
VCVHVYLMSFVVVVVGEMIIETINVKSPLTITDTLALLQKSTIQHTTYTLTLSLSS